MDRYFAVEFMVNIANGEFSVEDLSHILEKHSVEK